MTFKNKKKIGTVSVLTIIVTVIAVAAIVDVFFSFTIAQETFAINPSVEIPVDINRLQEGHQILTEYMIQGNLTTRIDKEVINSVDAEIPIVLSFIDSEKKLIVVGIHNKGKLDNFAYEQKLRNLVGDTPIEIVRGEFVRDACANKGTDPCRPLWGGTKLQVPATNLYGTLGIKATTTSGLTGFIMSGHVAGIYGTTGDTVYQPDNTPTSNNVGIVHFNPKLQGQTRSADAAFIKLATGISVEDKIYKASNSANTVIGKRGIIYTPPGTNIKMMSYLTSDEISGTVHSTGITVSDSIGTLTDQVRATWTGYTTQTGDSGSPIYSPPSSNNVYFYGIHVGKFCIGSPTPCGGSVYPMYSAWEAGTGKGIKTHLGLSS